MKILKELPPENYPDIFLDSKTPLYEFISKLTSLLNKEQEFIEFISTIKYWYLPKVSLWSFVSILNYIDELLFKYSEEIKGITVKNRLKPLLNFLLLLIRNSINLQIFSSLDVLEIIFLKTFDIKLKIVIVDIYIILSNVCGNSFIKYHSKLLEAGYVFMNMRKVLMEFMDNNYQFNEKVKYYLEEILLKQQKKFENIMMQKGKIFEKKNPLLIFKEIINKNSDYRNKDNFPETKTELEYFSCNNKIYEQFINNLIPDEIKYIISINNFFCVLNFLAMMNNKKIDTKEIYLGFKLTFSFLDLCCLVVPGFENLLINEEYKETLIKDILKVLTTKNNINIKLEFMIYFSSIHNLNNGYEYILFQNGLFQNLLGEMTHQKDNSLTLLTKEESYNQKFLNLLLICYKKYSKDIPMIFQESILLSNKDNIYLYNPFNVLYCLNINTEYNDHLFNQILIPRLLCELENLKIPEVKFKYIYLKEDENNYEYPLLIDRIDIINTILRTLYKYIQRSTNIEIVNKIDTALINLFKTLISNEEMKNNINFNSVYVNFIYLILKICNAFPTKIPIYLSEGVIKLIIDYFTDYLPKANGVFYLIIFAIYTVSIHNKGKEFLLEKKYCINMINSVFNKMKKDDEYFYYKLYSIDEIITQEYFVWVNLIKNEEIFVIVDCLFDNFNSFLDKIKEDYKKLRIDYNENLNPNLGQYLINNKLKFIFHLLYEKNNNRDIISILLYQNKIKQISKSFIFLLNKPNFLLFNSFTPQNIDSIISKAESSNQILPQFYKKYEQLNKKLDTLNLHQYQKDKIMHNYKQIVENCFNSFYNKSNFKKEYLYDYCSIFMKFSIEKINKTSNLDLFFMKYSGKAFKINDNIYIYILSKNIKEELRKYLIRMLKLTNNKEGNKYIIFNEDNYLDIKIEPKFGEKIKIQLFENNDYNLLNEEFIEKRSNNNLIVNIDYFTFIRKIGRRLRSTDLHSITLEDCEIIKNYINLSYMICLVLKYFRKTFFENVSSYFENIDIQYLIKLANILNILNDLLTGKNSIDFSSIIFFYIIKFGGVRQLFKLAHKLIELCKKESNKNEIPLIESLLINKIWEYLYSLILFFARFQFNKRDGFFLILILENDITKKLIYRNEINIYAKYMILKDLKEVFFKNEDLEENSKFFEELENYSHQMYKIILFILEDFYKWSSLINLELKFDKIYKQDFKVFEVIFFLQKDIYSPDSILELLQKNKNNKKRHHNINDSECVNDVLQNIENYEPYPETKFIFQMKKTIDEENKVFKSQKDKENKNIKNNSMYNDYQFQKYNVLLNEIIYIICNANISKITINNLRIQNLICRKLMKDNSDSITIMENALNELNLNEKNFILNEDTKLEKELKIKMRINYNILSYHQISDIYLDNSTTIYNFIINNNITKKCVNSIRNVIDNYNKNKFKQIDKVKIKNFIYENLVTIYLCFKYINKIKKDFNNEKKIFLDLFFDLLQNESDASNQNKNILNANILIMFLLNIVNNFNDSKIFDSYLQKGLLTNLINLELTKEYTFNNFYENNFKLKVILDDCFKQFVHKIFSEDSIMEYIIERVILYAWANLKSKDEKREIYLEDFLYLCSEYSEMYPSIFKKVLMNIFDVVQIEVKEKSNIYKKNVNKKKNSLIIKQSYKSEINKIKKEFNISEYINPLSNYKKEEKLNSDNKNQKEKKQIYSELNKSLFRELLKHIWICTTKLEKEIENNKENKIIQKNYIFDLDTSLIALSRIIFSFPSYLSLIMNLNLHKGKGHNISFTTFLVKHVFPLLNYSYLYLYKNSFEEEEFLDNNIFVKDSDMGIMESFRNTNIIKKIVQSMTYRKRIMNKEEIFIMKKFRKKFLSTISDSLKEISTKNLKDFNLNQKLSLKVNKNLITYKSDLLLLFTMTDFFKDDQLYSQYNPFEISKIIFSDGCEIIESINNILKNMNLQSNNKVYHELGVRYLESVLRYVRKNCKVKVKNVNANLNEEKKELSEIIEPNMNVENKEESESENFEENIEGSGSNYLIVENRSFLNMEDECENNSNNLYDNRLENEEDDEFQELDDLEEENEEHINSNSEDSDNDLDRSNLNDSNENIIFEEDNFNNMEQNLNLNDIIEIEQNNNNNIPLEEENQFYEDEIGESNEFEESEEMLDDYNENTFHHHDHFHNFYDEYNEDDSHTFESDEDYEDEFFSNIGLFKDKNNKKYKNNPFYDKYYEDSLSMMFSFEKIPSINDLIFFYTSNIKIKFYEERRMFEKFEEISDLYIFKYISPIYDIIPCYNFTLLGLSDSIFGYYILLYSKISANFDRFLGKYDEKNIDEKILKQIRNDIIKEIEIKNVIEEKEIKNDNQKQKQVNINNKDIEHHTEYDKILNKGSNINFYSSEYLFYPFIHFDELSEEKKKNEKEKEKIKDKKEKNKNDIIELEEKDKKSEKNEEQNQEKKDENNWKEKIKNEDEKNKNKEEIDTKQEKNISDEIKINNNDDQFILSLPNELREEILLTLDPSLVPNLSIELQTEYYRLNGQEIPKSPNTSINLPPPLNNSSFKVDLKIENTDYLNEFQYNEIELVEIKYKEEDTFKSNFHKGNLVKKLKSFDDDFIENLFIYNIRNIFSNKTSLLKNEYSFTTDDYFNLIVELIVNSELKFKIMDLFFVLWIYNIYNNNITQMNFDFRKNNFLDKINYLNYEIESFEVIFTLYCEQFFSKLMKKYSKEMNKYFTNFTFNENGIYLSLKNNKKNFYSTKNAMERKNIIKIKYDKNLNVLGNLLKIFFSEKNNYFQNIFILRIFTDIIKQCKTISRPNTIHNKKTNNQNNNILVSIDENTLENIIDLYNNFKIFFNSKKSKSDNIPTALLNELMIDKSIYQLIYDKILRRLQTLKNEIINNISDSFLNDNKIIDVNIYNHPFPENILLSLLKFIGNICNKIFIKYNNKLKDSKVDNKNTKKELLTKSGEFIEKIIEILFPCWEKLNYLLNEINSKIKEKSNILESKYLIIFPFLDSLFIVSFLYINYFSKDNKNNTVQFIIEKNYKSETKSPLRNDLIIFNDSSFIEFFYKFCDDNKKIINLIFKKYPKKFPKELILIISKILDLENKKIFFKKELKNLPYSSDYLRIKVRRQRPNLFKDSFGSLYSQKAEKWRSKLIVSFKDEEAIDAGGVKREWLTILSKDIFDPSYMLFTLAKNGTTYTINSDSGRFNPEHLQHFEFIGKIMAKAIFDGMMLDCYFTRNIYKLITNTPISYHDMEDYDPIFYKSLKSLLENDYTGKDTYLTYSYNHDNFGEMQIIDLVENGRNIDVTESNKFDFVQKLCSAKLYENIKPQVEALLKGFYSIIPQKLISIFNHRELELVISGLPTIDIKDWKRNTLYENYNEQTPIIKYFWEIIESYDNDERAEFLQFVTGSSKVPLEGFCALQGIGGVNKFLISKVFDKNYDRLPTAHTCTNQLDLPEYPNKEILKQRLKVALKEGKGFGFV